MLNEVLVSEYTCAKKKETKEVEGREETRSGSSRLIGRKWDYPDNEASKADMTTWNHVCVARTGKKTTLVERLRDYETVQSSTSGSRGISSSAIAFKSSSSSSTENEDQAPLPEASKVEVASGVEANVNVVPEIVVPDVEPALAPGLPEAKSDLQEAPPTLDIKMPEFEEQAPEFALPVSPDHTRSTDSVRIDDR